MSIQAKLDASRRALGSGASASEKADKAWTTPSEGTGCNGDGGRAMFGVNPLRHLETRTVQRAIIATLALAAAAFTSTMAHGQDAETYPPTVPLMLPATDSFLQSFVRLINKGNEAGEVRITAVDDGGNVYDPV